MKGDFTRRTFRPGNHYRGVLLQQGRVALDADWNEQLDIQLHLDETTARDAVGVHGGPKDAAGFAITTPEGGTPAASPGADLTLSAGRYYVNGVLCEIETPVPLAAQPDLPGVPLPTDNGRYVAYLDVWREHLTALERPELREVALGGPDTGTRSRTVWQVRLEPAPGPEAVPADVAAPWEPSGSRPSGRMRARAEPDPTATTPCVLPPSAGYRRLENQLYRVEIRESDDGVPSFVWSRDNGTVAALVVRLTTDATATTLTIDTPARDERLGFAKGDWVEVCDPARTRRGEQGFLGRLDEADGTTLRVTEWSGPAPADGDLADPVVVRRWDSPGALPVRDGWVALEDGVQVQFEDYRWHRTGDYWLIPARTAAWADTDLDPDLAGTVEWPRDPDGTPAFRPPDGIEHHTAAIALLDLTDGAWTTAYDCRALFAPLAETRPDPSTPPFTPGLHVVQVLLTGAGRELRNDTGISQTDLLGGLAVALDGPPAPVATTGRPVLTVTMDLPFPLSSADRADWHLPAGTVLGTQPVTLAGRTAITGRQLTWEPADALHGWLEQLAIQLLDGAPADRLYCRLTVSGRAVVHADHPDRVLNGLALPRFRPEDGGTDLQLPTVDDVRGADFTCWFWVQLSRDGAVFDTSSFDQGVFQ
ncbi:DUF6519 domain-containing protein [Streptomyces sp. NPDC051016]|uniref:DUF6519 domain-containing protein n=1 Tax=Streptomyces sp. NPDC051016 TaxID=3365638 RepID=UPI0037B7040E